MGFDRKVYLQLAITSANYSSTVFDGVHVFLLCVPCRVIQLLYEGSCLSYVICVSFA
jgi:hypothetical protein